MKLIFYCPFCKKTIEKKPRRIGNTVYIPDYVTHKHGRITYPLECHNFDDWMRNPKNKGY